MSHVICVDGLGGVPQVTFNGLRIALEKAGHTVHYAHVDEVVSHGDRISRVVSEVIELSRKYPSDKFFLIGQSAGGSAVRCAVALLDEKYLPHGIVLLSSAMPRGIRYGTKTLRRIMIRYWLRLFTDEYISLTDDELLDLVRPVPDSSIPIITRSQPQTATAEARKLAFYPDKLKPVRCHCSIIYGDKDQWINPNAQETLARNIRTVNRTAGIKAVVTTNRIPGAGHLSLFHGTTAIDYICRWCVY